MPFDGLDNLVAKGQNLLDEHDAVQAHREFNNWINGVSEWLNKKFPNSGLSADWVGQVDSNLVMGGKYYDNLTS
jgi:hypothetical protein